MGRLVGPWCWLHTQGDMLVDSDGDTQSMIPRVRDGGTEGGGQIGLAGVCEHIFLGTVRFGLARFGLARFGLVRHSTTTAFGTALIFVLFFTLLFFFADLDGTNERMNQRMDGGQDRLRRFWIWLHVPTWWWKWDYQTRVLSILCVVYGWIRRTRELHRQKEGQLIIH